MTILFDTPELKNYQDSLYKGDYFLSDEEFDCLEADLVGLFQENDKSSDEVISLAVNPTSKFAALARTGETRAFPDYDSSVAMQSHEDRSLFLFTIDLSSGVIVHTKRVVLSEKDVNPEAAFRTGIEVIDDRLRATDPEEHCTLQDVMEYHRITDISKCWNITSNFSSDKARPSLEKPYALMSYKALFQLGKVMGITHLFAYTNHQADKSLGKLGLQSDLLLGKEYHLPDSSNFGVYLDEYHAVCLPYSPENCSVFTQYNPNKPLTKVIATKNIDNLYLDDDNSLHQIV